MTIRRDELHALADVGFREGVLKEQESNILRNLLRFGELRAHDVMTPRTVMFALPEESTVREVMDKHPDLQFSRIPIYKNDKDRIRGFVLKSQILLHAARGEDATTLASFMSPILAISETMPLADLFDKLVQDRMHMAIVIGEYGGTSGLVTLEDIVETLLGLEIMDEADSVEDMQRLAREKWKARARRMGIDVPGELDDD